MASTYTNPGARADAAGALGDVHASGLNGSHNTEERTGGQLSLLGQKAVAYASERAWRVFPIKPDTKGGKGNYYLPHGYLAASNDPERVRGWWERWPNANIGLYLAESGLVALDPDLYKPDCAWSTFIEGHDLPDTLVQRSARGGRHYIFEAPAGATFKGTLCKGVEIKHKGYILLEPSTFEGKPYCFETDDDPAPVPDWVPRKGSREKPRDRERDDGWPNYSPADLAEARALLAERENTLDRDDWVSVIHGLKRAFGNDIRAEFLEWSYRWEGPTKEGDPERTWDGATPDGRAGLGTVFWLLRQERPLQSAGGRQSRFYSASELKGKPVPPREWLVPDLVPGKTVTLFSGDGGTGKSLLALQLAVGVVAEAGWIGKPVKQGSVIFLSAEDDDDELHRRLEGILAAEGRDYEDLGKLTLRSLAGEDALLAIEGKIALMKSALFEELDKRAEADSPALIVLDTLADVYPANENDRAKVRQFVGILRGLAIKRKCAVMLLGHPSLTGLSSGSGTSGSTAWNNSVRSRLYLSRIVDGGHEPDPDARVLASMKANYSRVGGEISLRWQAGVFVAQEQPDGLAAGAKAERVFLKLLAELTAQGRRVNPQGGPNYAPKVFAEHPDAEGCTKRAFRTAMERLLASRRIRIDRKGPPSKHVSFLVEGEE